MTPDPLNLVWIDLEMTGLDTTSDLIIEIATLVTSPDLRILGEGPSLVIGQPREVLDQMDEWNQEHHSSSGLLAEVSRSSVTCAEAETRTLEFLKQYAVPGKSPMCGNSVCQDRRFLAREMPRLEAFFHYRNLDVSTLKELAIRWKPEMTGKISKQSAHRAMDDVYSSIEELKLYREELMSL